MRSTDLLASNVQLPSECTLLSNSLPNGGKFIFDDKSWLPWIMIVVYVVTFTIPILYVAKYRNEVSFQTRSPKLIIFSLLYMMGDCISNTVLFSRHESKTNSFTFQCDMGIALTVVFFFGILSIYFLRMWRIYKVFHLYQRYLEDQMKEIEKDFINDSSLSADKIATIRPKSEQVFATESLLEENPIRDTIPDDKNFNENSRISTRMSQFGRESIGNDS